MSDNVYEKDLQYASARSWQMDTLYASVFDHHVRIPDDIGLQMVDHIDLIASKDRDSLFIEEKCIRTDWPDLFIEVWSSTKNGIGHAPGWFRHQYPKEMRILLHFIFPTQNVLLDFKRFQKWAKPKMLGDNITWRKHTMPTVNHSQGFLCPIAEIPADCWYQPLSGSASYQRWHAKFGPKAGQQ